MSYDTFVHLFAGGLGGTFGAIVTCPLEVVKTRLQSSVAKFDNETNKNTPSSTSSSSSLSSKSSSSSSSVIIEKNPGFKISKNKGLTIWNCIQHIIKTEGPTAIFKGLGPNIIGVAPSRALYFMTYSRVKTLCNNHLTPETPYVHMISAASAGFVSCTLTNPIWFIKTRMQLDQSLQGMTAWSCVKNVYKNYGIPGFYKGITASYFGISETIIHFVIYEFIKSKWFNLDPFYNNNNNRNKNNNNGINTNDNSPIEEAIVAEPPPKSQSLSFVQYMAAAAMSKSFASIIAYPHEVARTRLREEGDKYRRFFQTIITVYKEEGIRNGLYRGLATQLIRQIPNTAIMMGTYEVVVYFMKNLPISSSIRNESSPPPPHRTTSCS